MKAQRAIDAHQEQKTKALLRDTRTTGQKACDFIKKPYGAASIILFFAAVTVVDIPGERQTVSLSILADIFLLSSIIIFCSLGGTVSSRAILEPSLYSRSLSKMIKTVFNAI